MGEIEDHEVGSASGLLESFQQLGASLGVVERVEILPFHQLGQYKWERLGLDYKLASTDPPTNQGVAKAVAPR